MSGESRCGIPLCGRQAAVVFMKVECLGQNDRLKTGSAGVSLAGPSGVRRADVDFDSEIAKIDSFTIEQYDHEEDEVPDELYDSRYANGIKLAQMAMLEYCRLPDPDEASAKAFLANHLDKDVDELDMPRVRFVEADEDCDE